MWGYSLLGSDALALLPLQGALLLQCWGLGLWGCPCPREEWGWGDFKSLLTQSPLILSSISHCCSYCQQSVGFSLWDTYSVSEDCYLFTWSLNVFGTSGGLEERPACCIQNCFLMKQVLGLWTEKESILSTNTFGVWEVSGLYVEARLKSCCSILQSFINILPDLVLLLQGSISDNSRKNSEVPRFCWKQTIYLCVLIT